MTNTENSLTAELTELATQQDTLVADLIWGLAIGESNEAARQLLVRHFGFVSDSLLQDLLDEYAPEELDDEDE